MKGKHFMKKYSRENLSAIQAIVQEKTGAAIVPDRKPVGYKIRKMALLAGSLLCLAALVDDLDNQKVGADGFTRAYTEEERKMGELIRKYQEGTFPEGELVQTESGGITEEEAVEIAKEWLIKIYGITEEGLEIKHYFSENSPIAGKTEFYHVNCRDFSNRLGYFFWIDAKDGSLVRTIRRERNAEKEAFAVTEAEALLPELKQGADLFIKEQLQQTYKDVYYAYYSVNDVLNGSVSFIFVREDNSAFTLNYYWNGNFMEFYESQFSTYEEKYADMKEMAEDVEYYKHGGEEVEIILFFEKIENME